MKITHMVNLQHIMDQEGFLGQAAYTESQVRPSPAFCADCLQLSVVAKPSLSELLEVVPGTLSSCLKMLQLACL